jgi:hypothetical protein
MPQARSRSRAGNLKEELEMSSKIMLLAFPAALAVAPVFAQEGTANLKEGEAFMVTSKGTVHKSSKQVSDAKHEAALKKGAKEVARGTVFYMHRGTLWSVPCTGEDIGAWVEGNPGTENAC